MRIGFLDVWAEPYSVGSVFERPLGGTQSAMSYLAMALAAAGQQVFYICNTPAAGMVQGVWNIAREGLTAGALRDLRLDALILFQVPGNGAELRQVLGDRCKMVLLSMDYADLPMLDPLHGTQEVEAWDAVAVVSEWQRGEFLRHFGLPSEKVKVMRNAAGPAFEGLFGEGEGILARKDMPPVLAYTSTPFRGLKELVEMFPEIRRRVPGARLRVFSGMRVYSMAAANEAALFGRLYEACRGTEGVEYVGNLRQAELAKEMQGVSVLAYPNTYAETSCISVMEAMAAGCGVVTSERAALPETAAGFAQLVSGEPATEAYQEKFVELVVEMLREQVEKPVEEEARRRRQVGHFARECCWGKRAEEWVGMLEGLVDMGRGA